MKPRISDQVQNKINMTTVSKSINKIETRIQRYIVRLIEKKKNDIRWQHKYSFMFSGGTAVDIFEFRTFLMNVVQQNTSKKQLFLKRFAEKILEHSLYAYVVAEFLEPIIRLVAKDIRKTDIPSAEKFLAAATVDISFFKKIAQEKTEEIIEKKERHLLRMSLHVYGFGKSDFLMNRSVPALDILKQLVQQRQKGNTKKIEKLLDSFPLEAIIKTISEMSAQSAIFSSFKETNEYMPARSFVDLINCAFRRYFKNIEFDIKESGATNPFYKIDELTLLQVFYAIVENAIEAGATKISIFVAEIIRIQNNGTPITTTESVLAKDKFFSTKNKAGLGLFLADRLLKRRSGSILIEENSICIYLKIRKKN